MFFLHYKNQIQIYLIVLFQIYCIASVAIHMAQEFFIFSWRFIRPWSNSCKGFGFSKNMEKTWWINV